MVQHFNYFRKFHTLGALLPAKWVFYLQVELLQKHIQYLTSRLCCYPFAKRLHKYIWTKRDCSTPSFNSPVCCIKMDTLLNIQCICPVMGPRNEIKGCMDHIHQNKHWILLWIVVRVKAYLCSMGTWVIFKENNTSRGCNMVLKQLKMFWCVCVCVYYLEVAKWDKKELTFLYECMLVEIKPMKRLVGSVDTISFISLVLALLVLDYAPPSSTHPEFKPMVSGSWQEISCYWDP